MNKTYMLLGILLLGGLAFAISGASVSSEAEQGKWDGLYTGSAPTEGGNVSGVNIEGNYSTEKWAAFYGDVSTGIVLADSAGINVYNWTYSAESGEVCLNTGGTFNWASAAATTANAVDSQFGLVGTDADSANNTLTGSCTVTLLDVASPITGAPSVVLKSGYETCALQDGTPSTKDDLAFCVDIGTANNYNGTAVNYEIMVPTSDNADATETYYFFVELV